MPYMAVGPDVRVGAKTLGELLAKLDQDAAETVGISRRLLRTKSQSAYQVRYVDKDNPEYGAAGQYVGGRELSGDEQTELDRLHDRLDAMDDERTRLLAGED